MRVTSPLLVAQHAAVARRVVEQRRQQRELAARAVADERFERLRPNQRHVAAQHEHAMVVGNRRHRLHDGMARAELLGLQRPLQIGLVRERGADLLGAVAVDDVDRRRARMRARSANDVLEQRPARERLQHLRQCRVHALALARGENDYGNRHQMEPFSPLDWNHNAPGSSQADAHITSPANGRMCVACVTLLRDACRRTPWTPRRE